MAYTQSERELCTFAAWPVSSGGERRKRIRSEQRDRGKRDGCNGERKSVNFASAGSREWADVRKEEDGDLRGSREM